MSLEERTYSLLLVSASDAFNEATEKLLTTGKYLPFITVKSISEAKRYVTQHTVDLIVINSPLPDDAGVLFSVDCCKKTQAVVLMLAKSDAIQYIVADVSEYGVFLLQKPVARSAMQTALLWMASTRERLRITENKKLSLEERMNEIKITNRAKYLLISVKGLSEPEAHHFVEKYAMDKCISKKSAAEEIIKLYS
ncbi:MAG: ANTAR domain-containing protein [Clostridiales bacterium]|nr:ANTAR domain-containing protein [Clostridiales bacterium]